LYSHAAEYAALFRPTVLYLLDGWGEESMAKFYEHTIKMRVYYSSYHLWAARHFAQLSSNIEATHIGKSYFDIEHRAYVTSTIFTAVAFMEAAINELFQDAADDHQSYITHLDDDLKITMTTTWNDTKNGKFFKSRNKATERENRKEPSILVKYQTMLDFAKVGIFLKNEQPYVDAKLVIQLRNELVHYKPKIFDGSPSHEFEELLKDKFPLNPLITTLGNPYFPDKCLGYGCAQWAVDSCKNFVDTFFAKLR
jgi:hypothetical protein